VSEFSQKFELCAEFLKQSAKIAISQELFLSNKQTSRDSNLNEIRTQMDAQKLCTKIRATQN
jgi:hypothetical protein